MSFKKKDKQARVAFTKTDNFLALLLFMNGAEFLEMDK